MVALTKETTVRELLTDHPEVFSVFLGHGMCADCEAAPPPVPLDHFAGKHCDGDIDGLLDEIRNAIHTDPQRSTT